MESADFTYSSSIDAIANLYAKVRYPTGGSSLPIVILMHGWDGTADSFDSDTLDRIANYGFFVAVPGLRSKNGADGTKDASGRECYDIYDLLQYVLANYPAVIDLAHVAIVGYSGGGGNALGVACKFPDLFNVVIDHFGMSDYGYNNPDGWYYNNDGSYTGEIVVALGGIPAAVPNSYRARNAVEAITNYTGGHLYLFHDDADTIVPIVHSQRIGAAMLAASLSNYTENYTDAGDSPRWLHGYPTMGSELSQSEAIWTPAISTQAAWSVASGTTQRVIGYIKTKLYTCWLRATGTATWGLNAVADVQFIAPYKFIITPQSGAIDAIVTAGGHTFHENNFNVAATLGATMTTTSLTIQPGPADGQDTILNSLNAVKNYGNATNFFSVNTAKGLIRFNVSMIPSVAICTGATMYLYQVATGAAQAWTVNVYSIAIGNTAWLQGAGHNPAIAGECCWNWKDDTSVAWAGSAGLSTVITDYEPAIIGSFSGNCADANGTEYACILSPARVQGWFGSPNTNHGLLLVLASGTNVGSLGSSDHATVAWRPKLTVGYRNRYAPLRRIR